MDNSFNPRSGLERPLVVGLCRPDHLCVCLYWLAAAQRGKTGQHGGTCPDAHQAHAVAGPAGAGPAVFPCSYGLWPPASQGQLKIANDVLRIVIVEQAARRWGLPTGALLGRADHPSGIPALSLSPVFLLVYIQAGRAARATWRRIYAPRRTASSACPATRRPATGTARCSSACGRTARPCALTDRIGKAGTSAWWAPLKPARARCSGCSWSSRYAWVWAPSFLI